MLKYDQPVSQCLREYAGRRVFFEPLEGNRGDELILRGAMHMMESTGLQQVSRPEEADLILINGGGGLFVQPWCGTLTRFHRYAQGFQDTPLIVLPSSYYWHPADLVACLAGRRAPTILFARESFSHARLLAEQLPDSVAVGLDHDMALHLEDTDLVRAAVGMPTGNYVLVVERFDEESATKPSSSDGPLRRIGRLLPGPIANVLRKMLDMLRRQSSDLVNSSVQKACALRPELAGIPVFYSDVSNPTRNSFENFIETVAKADAVITTRLHAGILGSMLNKPVFLIDSVGDYRKLQGVYEFSLKQRGDVYMLN